LQWDYARIGRLALKTLWTAANVEPSDDAAVKVSLMFHGREMKFASSKLAGGIGEKSV